MRYESLYSEEESLDIQNPVYDLLIKEEEIMPAARRAQEDVSHIDSRLRSLEDANPHREALEEAAGSAFCAGAESGASLSDIKDAVDELNGPNSVDPVRLLVGMANGLSGTGIAAGVLLSTAPPVMLGLGAANLLVAGNIGRMYLSDSIRREEEVRSLVNGYLEFSDGVHKGRENFDELWARLVGDEDRDQLPQEE